MSLTLEVFNIIQAEKQRLHRAHSAAYSAGGLDYESRMKRCESLIRKWIRREARWVDSDKHLFDAIIRWKTR